MNNPNSYAVFVDGENVGCFESLSELIDYIVALVPTLPNYTTRTILCPSGNEYWIDFTN